MKRRESVAVPLTVNGNLAGAVITKQRISDDKFVSKIAALYDVKAEYFSGYTRVYSTYTLMTGSKMQNTQIIDSVMKGKPVQAIIKRLKFVGHSIKALSSGEADLTQRISVKGRNEFSELGTDVNAFIEILQTLVQKLNGAQQTRDNIDVMDSLLKQFTA